MGETVVKKDLSNIEWVDIRRDEFYPAEENIRPDFIEAVEEAERRVAEGNVLTYSVDEFKKKFL